MQLFTYTTLALASLAAAQGRTRDPGTYGPGLEVVHQYFGQWPTGITVSSTGRKFANFPAGLDANNTNTGTVFKYQVAEILNNGTEVPYPSREFNNPPGGSINQTTNPPTSIASNNHWVGVQSVVLDANDRLWVLDSARVTDPASGVTLNAATNGPKLVGVDIRNGTVFKTITLPPTVGYADGYLNDVRIDLRKNLSGISGNEGVAYITDSSNEGRNGIIIIDLGNGNSWRHLDADPRVRPEQQVIPFVWGQPVYGQMPKKPKSFVPFGSDGIALSADGNTLYFGPVAGRSLYSIPTERLRDNGPNSEVAATSSIQNRGQKGITDGMETDSNGNIYAQNAEQSSINAYNPTNFTVTPFVRDPRISWADTLSVATDGYLYFNDNQFSFAPFTYPGTDRRIPPYILFRAKLPGNGTKINPAR